MRYLEQQRRWLLPAVLILFILEIVTLPFVIGLTYSGRSEEPNHVLTYTANSSNAKLTWDSATGIRNDGSAELDLFDAIYPSVQANNGENVIAPGTDGFNIIRLKNSVGGTINYTAVLYRIRTSDKLPVYATLSGENFIDTANYPLPNGVEENQVVRAVTGTLGGNQIQDFDINWLWSYYDDEAQDIVDTYLGDEAAFCNEEKVTVGFYITVEDGNNYISEDDNDHIAEDGNDYIVPTVPKTGDDSMLGLYFTLMGISGLMLILLLVSRRREEKCDS